MLQFVLGLTSKWLSLTGLKDLFLCVVGNLRVYEKGGPKIVFSDKGRGAWKTFLIIFYFIRLKKHILEYLALIWTKLKNVNFEIRIYMTCDKRWWSVNVTTANKDNWLVSNYVLLLPNKEAKSISRGIRQKKIEIIPLNLDFDLLFRISEA